MSAGLRYHVRRRNVHVASFFYLEDAVRNCLEHADGQIYFESISGQQDCIWLDSDSRSVPTVEYGLELALGGKKLACMAAGVA